MRRNHFFLSYFLLLVLQIFLCNYFNLTPLLSLSILPVLILMLPIRYGTIFAMLLAFVSGLSRIYKEQQFRFRICWRLLS